MSAKQSQQFLQQHFKLNNFRPGQEAIINSLLSGRSALALFPTGGGKSLCYQLPALMLPGITVVVSPLVALMKDQADALATLGINAVRFDASLDREQLEQQWQSLETGNSKLLYVSPERLKNDRFVRRLSRLRISLLAVDEAHCISEWGHNFRPDYLKLAALAQQLEVERVLALTATATPEVVRDICQQFHIGSEDFVSTGFYRPNLNLHISPCSDSERLPLLIERLKQNPAGSTIVYVTLQQTAETVAQSLEEHGLRASFYHAGLSHEERIEVQNAFMQGDCQIVVATIAFGMGIDKQDIRAVYHYNLPKSLENYLQEVGRAGRDGKPAHCEMLACRDDEVVLNNFIYGDTPAKESLLLFSQHILAQADTFDIASYELAHQFDIRPLVINTALTYLELEGVIKATVPFYSSYQVAFLQPPEAIYQGFDRERADFLSALFKQGKQGRKWLTLDLQQVSQQLNEPRERIMRALDYLQEKQLINCQVSGLRQGYQRLKQIDATTITARMVSLFERRENNDIARVEQVLSLAASPGCITHKLLAYFETDKDKTEAGCGHCSQCLTPAAPLLPAASKKRFHSSQLNNISGLIDEQHPALYYPRQLARFLCGLASPATTRAKLKNHPMFGRLRDYPFPQVLATAEELMHSDTLSGR